MASVAGIPSGSPARHLTPLHRNHSFVVLVASQSVSRLGDAMVNLAAVWLVLELTGNDPLASSALLAIQFLPFLLFGVLGGVLADRWDRRLAMSSVDAVRGALLLIVPLLHAAGALQVWHVPAVIFALNSLDRLFVPARQALIPDLVDRSQLVRANAVAEGSSQMALVLGPALAGVLVALIGAVNVFYIDAASFVLSAAALLTVRTPRAPRSPSRGLWRDLAGGVRHVRRSPLLRATFLLMPSGTVAFAPVPALLPVLVRGDFAAGSRAFGVLMACFFAGTVAGSAAIGRLGERLHRGRTFVLALLGLGVATIALAVAPSAMVAGVILALLGMLVAAFNVAEFSLLQTATPSELRGRVFALADVASQCLRPAAVLAAGLAASAISVRLALGLLAWAALVAGLAGLRSRVLRTTG